MLPEQIGAADVAAQHIHGGRHGGIEADYVFCRRPIGPSTGEQGSVSVAIQKHVEPLSIATAEEHHARSRVSSSMVRSLMRSAFFAGSSLPLHVVGAL